MPFIGTRPPNTPAMQACAGPRLDANRDDEQNILISRALPTSDLRVTPLNVKNTNTGYHPVIFLPLIQGHSLHTDHAHPRSALVLYSDSRTRIILLRWQICDNLPIAKIDSLP